MCCVVDTYPVEVDSAQSIPGGGVFFSRTKAEELTPLG